MSRRIALIALLAAALAVPAAAQTTTAANQRGRVTIAQRLQLQAARIRAGVQSGQITPAERERLVTAESALRSRLQALRQSGRTLTPVQRRRAVVALNRLSLAIRRAMRR